MVTYIKICYNSYMGATLEGGSGGPSYGGLWPPEFTDIINWYSIEKGGLANVDDWDIDSSYLLRLNLLCFRIYTWKRQHTKTPLEPWESFATFVL